MFDFIWGLPPKCHPISNKNSKKSTLATEKVKYVFLMCLEELCLECALLLVIVPTQNTNKVLTLNACIWAMDLWKIQHQVCYLTTVLIINLNPNFIQKVTQPQQYRHWIASKTFFTNYLKNARWLKVKIKNENYNKRRWLGFK